MFPFHKQSFSPIGKDHVFLCKSKRLSISLDYRFYNIHQYSALRCFCCFLMFSFFIVASSANNEKSYLNRVDHLPYYQSQEREGLLVDSLMIRNLLDNAKANHQNDVISPCENALGVLARESGQFKLAFRFFESVIQRASQNQDELMRMVGLNNYGVICRRLDRLDEATRYHVDALRLAENMDDDNWLVIKTKCVSLNSLGNIFLSMQQPDKAMEFFKQALILENQLGSHLGMAINFANMGAALAIVGKPDSALIYYHKAMHYNVLAKSRSGVAISHTCMGDILSGQKQYGEAMQHFQQARAITDSIGDTYHWLNATHSYLKTLVAIDNILLARLVAFDAIDKARRSGVIYYLSEMSLLLANVFEAENNLSLSVKYLKQGYAYRDSMIALSNAEKIQDLQLKYESEKMEQQIKWLQDKAASHRLIQNVFLLLAVALLLLAVAFWYIARLRKRDIGQQNLLIIQEQELNRMQQQQFTNQLQLKSHELTTLAVQLAAKSEILSGVREHLQDKGVARELVASLNVGINLENDWEVFRKQFQGVHPSFFRQLKVMHPDVTPKDERLCACLRLNMTTKEVASILNVTPQAVDKSRNRLRKKLNIEASVNLYEFLIEVG